MLVVSGLDDDVDVLGLASSDSVELSPREPSLDLENISFLNASTPRSTSAVRAGTDEEEGIVFARNGLRAALDGATEGGGENSCDERADFVLSGTRDTAR